MLEAKTFSSGSKSGFLSFLRVDLGLVHHLVLLCSDIHIVPTYNG
jgi:hypothetical protein